MREQDECRPYVDHLRSEHRQLHDEVRGIATLLHEPAMTVSERAELPDRLGRLRDDLLRHFTEEEAGGCLEEAVSRCPNVAQQADALEHQHAQLLAAVQHIIDQASPFATSESLADVDEEFNCFAENLSAHEAAENRILQQAFGTTVNGEED